MLADWLVELVGRNPDAYTSTEDKLAVFFAGAVFYGWPLFLLLLFLAPFGFVWWKYRRFSLKSFGLSVLAGLLLVGLGIYLLYQGILFLQGQAFRDLYGF